MTLSSQCARALHRQCGRKMWSGRFCECACHPPAKTKTKPKAASPGQVTDPKCIVKKEGQSP